MRGGPNNDRRGSYRSGRGRGGRGGRGNNKSKLTEEELTYQKYLPRLKIRTKEELEAWILDRKRNYPTDENILKKKLETEKLGVNEEEKIENEKETATGLVDYEVSSSEEDATPKKDEISAYKETENIEPTNKKLKLDEETNSDFDEAPEEAPIQKEEKVEIKNNKKEVKKKKIVKQERKIKTHKHGDLYAKLQENEHGMYASKILQYLRAFEQTGLLNK